MAEASWSAPYAGPAKFERGAFCDELLRRLAAGGAAKALKGLGLEVPAEVAALAPW